LQVTENQQPILSDVGASILGPRNSPLERENRSLLAWPQTDSGTIPNLELSLAAARNRLLTGPDGRNFIADVGEGDRWSSPAGIPHSHG
jgi:hypothetical protein